jgi:hypothetical protein
MLELKGPEKYEISLIWKLLLPQFQMAQAPKAPTNMLTKIMFEFGYGCFYVLEGDMQIFGMFGHHYNLWAGSCSSWYTAISQNLLKYWIFSKSGCTIRSGTPFIVECHPNLKFCQASSYSAVAKRGLAE